VSPTIRSTIRAFEGLDVLVIGDAMLDRYLLGTSTRLCQEAPVPIASVNERDEAPGGAANVAANVAALGGRATLVGLVGDDADGEALRWALRRAGVEDGGIATEPRRRTLSKSRAVVDGQLLVRVDEGDTVAPDAASAAAIRAPIVHAWERSAAVIVSDYGYGVLTDEIVRLIADLQGRSRRVLVVDAKDLRRYRRLGPTAVKPNHAQVSELVGNAHPAHPAAAAAATGSRLLRATGAQIVTLTLDAEGAIAYERGHDPYRTYAKPTRAASTAGAGDTFTAAMALALAAGSPTPTAVEVASAAAAIVVAKDRTATCGADELMRLTAGGGKLVDGVDELAARVAFERGQGRRIVFTNGCFDLLHRGHVTYLSRAKALGDVLVVAVNSDDSVRSLKGSQRPVTPLGDRLEVLAALSCVDLVVPFEERTPERAIAAARPDVVVKGGDYTIEMLPEAELAERLGGTVTILPYVDDRSTSGIIERIRAEPVAELS
jgi:D-beta-D-heptose 7-phosphate kinase / D-beta-D-heptose 1-phosphate adenosyltransferase